MVKPNDHLTANLASCPSTENGNGNDRVDEPPEIRQPRSLQDLLRYAIEAGQGNGAAIAVQAEAELPGPLDHERRAFLEQALKSLTVDVAAELARAINVLRQLPGQGEDLSSCLESFDTISSLVDNIDAANDYYKLGGFEIVHNCLESPHDEVRCRMLEVVADCTQNNPFCQEQAVRMGFLKSVLGILRDTERQPSTECSSKAFYAMSNIVRAYPPGWDEFVKLKGLEAVVEALVSDSARLRTKAAFFLSSKLSENKEIIALLRPLRFIELLIERIKSDQGQCCEWTLEALKTIVESDFESCQEARSDKYQLRETFIRLENELAEDEANQEQLIYIAQLKQLLFPE